MRHEVVDFRDGEYPGFHTTGENVRTDRGVLGVVHDSVYTTEIEEDGPFAGQEVGRPVLVRLGFVRSLSSCRGWLAGGVSVVAYLKVFGPLLIGRLPPPRERVSVVEMFFHE